MQTGMEAFFFFVMNFTLDFQNKDFQIFTRGTRYSGASEAWRGINNELFAGKVKICSVMMN